jgi:hypothetical protein
MRASGTPFWQLPYLRVALIARRLDLTIAFNGQPARDARSERERRHLERVQRSIARAGWFN